MGRHSGALDADDRCGRILRKAPTYTPARITMPPTANQDETFSPVRIAASETVTTGISSVVYETADARHRCSVNTNSEKRTTEPSRTR